MYLGCSPGTPMLEQHAVAECPPSRAKPSLSASRIDDFATEPLGAVSTRLLSCHTLARAVMKFRLTGAATGFTLISSNRTSSKRVPSEGALS